MILVSYLSMSQYKNSATFRTSATVIPSVINALHGDTVQRDCRQTTVDLRLGRPEEGIRSKFPNALKYN